MALKTHVVPYDTSVLNIRWVETVSCGAKSELPAAEEDQELFRQKAFRSPSVPSFVHGMISIISV